MTTQKQINANRRNAKKSTGPRTKAGKERSSGNSFRHGLSLPLTLDPQTGAKLESIRILVAEQAGGGTSPSALQFALAQLDLHRIQGFRKSAMAEVERAPSDLRRIRHLAALDRYELRVLSRRQRASRDL
jgi:hypothetical protein